MIGDFNDGTGNRTGSEAVELYVEERVNNNGERIIELRGQYSFKITNGFYQHKDIHKHTR